MKYSKVYIDSIGYEIAPVVVSSAELEARLEGSVPRAAPFGGTARSPDRDCRAAVVGRGLPAFRRSVRARRAGARSRRTSAADQIEVLIYGGVCREHFEPATACRVGALLGVGPDTVIHDVSNACLGVLTGMVDIANRIELGQIRAGMVVSCETAREINEIVIDQMLDNKSMDFFKRSLATLDRRLGGGRRFAHRRLVVGIEGSAAAGRRKPVRAAASRALPLGHRGNRAGRSGRYHQFTSTDAASVLTHGVELGKQTWRDFSRRLGWANDQVDKVICHQVGSSHRETILRSLGIPESQGFFHFRVPGQHGHRLAAADGRPGRGSSVLQPGDRVAFLGIGSGLNCMMLGVEW